MMVGSDMIMLVTMDSRMMEKFTVNACDLF